MIENDKAVGEAQEGPKKTKCAPSGRKPAYESRATEFRQRLIVWKQTPESMRPSLRALAIELDTTHQMLGYYLNRLTRWQAEENAKRIRARAEAEGREMNLREWYETTVKPGLFRQIGELRQTANRGPLNSGQFKMLKLLATRFSVVRSSNCVLTAARLRKARESAVVSCLEIIKK